MIFSFQETKKGLTLHVERRRKKDLLIRPHHCASQASNWPLRGHGTARAKGRKAIKQRDTTNAKTARYNSVLGTSDSYWDSDIIWSLGTSDSESR